MKEEIQYIGAKEIRYEIGEVRLATVYGKVKVPAGLINGERQSVSITVKVIYIN